MSACFWFYGRSRNNLPWRVGPFFFASRKSPRKQSLKLFPRLVVRTRMHLCQRLRYAICCVCVTLAVGLPLMELVPFIHDRWVVRSEFACIESHWGDPDWERWAQSCGLENRKPFGWQSARAWHDGLPQLLMSMDVRTRHILAGVPLLLWATVLAVVRRREADGLPRFSSSLAAFGWLLMVALVFAFSFFPNWIDDPAMIPRALEFWWFIRIASLVWLLVLAALSVRMLRWSARNRGSCKR